VKNLHKKDLCKKFFLVPEFGIVFEWIIYIKKDLARNSFLFQSLGLCLSGEFT
jgi:hypothetical protein